MAKTAYAKQCEASRPDIRQEMTAEEAATLPGLLGRIAPAMLRRHGCYGFTRASDGARILIVLASK